MMNKIKVLDRKQAIEELAKNGEAVIHCNGNSMTKIMFPKDKLFLRRVEASKLRVGDACFCRINGGLQVHLISAIKDDRYTISNNKGWVNGTISASAIFGLCVRVEDRVRVSEKELEER